MPPAREGPAAVRVGQHMLIIAAAVIANATRLTLSLIYSTGCWDFRRARRPLLLPRVGEPNVLSASLVPECMTLRRIRQAVLEQLTLSQGTPGRRSRHRLRLPRDCDDN